MDPTPLDILYAKLIEIFSANTVIAAAIKQRNIIAFDEVKNDPQKKGVTSNDLPELVCYMGGFNGNLHSSTNTERVRTRWNLVLTSGTFDSRIIHGLSYGAWTTLRTWKDTLYPLQYNSKPFVLDCNWTDCTTGQTEDQYNRNIRGWVSIVAFEISLTLPSAL